MLNGISNGMAMSRPKQKCLQNKQVERSLKNFAFQRFGTAFRHNVKKVYSRR
jgi:hypothetical protein